MGEEKRSSSGRRNRRPADDADTVISVAAHPRISRTVVRVRAIAGLAAFVLTALVGLDAGVPLVDAALRALLAGIAAHVLAWMVAVAVARHVVVAEVRGRVLEAQRAAREAAEAARASDASA